MLHTVLFCVSYSSVHKFSIPFGIKVFNNMILLCVMEQTHYIQLSFVMIFFRNLKCRKITTDLTIEEII